VASPRVGLINPRARRPSPSSPPSTGPSRRLSPCSTLHANPTKQRDPQSTHHAAQLGSPLAVVRVALEHAALALAAGPDDASHGADLAGVESQRGPERTHLKQRTGGGAREGQLTFF
jgi:hypothetical protein